MNKKEIQNLIAQVNADKQSKLYHTPYSILNGWQPDFEVAYEFDISSPNAVRRYRQGLRCDYLYEGDDPKLDGIHMIWPEFLDTEGNVITDKTIEVDKTGKATMWIGRHELRVSIHRKRLRVGTKGFWMAGSIKIATVEVTKILGLFENQR